MGSLEINQIIGPERYPLDRAGHPAYQDLLLAGRRSLEEKALFSMAQFVRADATEPMALQMLALLPQSCRYDRPRNPYVYGFEEHALFSYDRDPGMVFDQAYVEELHDSMPG